ncbi:hypothetical protein Rs2_11551 [Raphanus sativus]|nr:hypothetical protein Rs2_11551 [Raphanus sativus]
MDRHFHLAIEKVISGERLISSLTVLLSTDLLRRHLLSTVDISVVLSTVLSTDFSVVLSTVQSAVQSTLHTAVLHSLLCDSKVRRGEDHQQPGFKAGEARIIYNNTDNHFVQSSRSL